MSNLPDAQVLHFIYDRLVQVHGENPNTDYMRRLSTITEQTHHLGNIDTDYGEPEQNLEADQTRQDAILGTGHDNRNPTSSTQPS